MSLTTVTKIDWTVKKSGRLIPKLYITPVNIPDPRGHIKVSKIHAHSAWWLLEKKAGVGAVLFLDTPYVFSVQSKAIPDVPQNCLCGSSVLISGRHIICPNEMCQFKGNGIITTDVPIYWVRFKM